MLGRLVALEPAQADLLTRICDEELIHASDIHEILAAAAPEEKSAQPKSKKKKKT